MTHGIKGRVLRIAVLGVVAVPRGRQMKTKATHRWHLRVKLRTKPVANVMLLLIKLKIFASFSPQSRY
jgi:hypothetical protein